MSAHSQQYSGIYGEGSSVVEFVTVNHETRVRFPASPHIRRKAQRACSGLTNWRDVAKAVNFETTTNNPSLKTRVIFYCGLEIILAIKAATSISN